MCKQILLFFSIILVVSMPFAIATDEECAIPFVQYFKEMPFPTSATKAQQIHVDDHSNITLSCQKPLIAKIVKYIWLTPVKTFVNAMDERSDAMHVKMWIKEDFYEYTLFIEDFTESLVGSYWCIWQIDNKFEATDRFMLNNTTPVDIQMTSGGNVEFECKTSFGRTKTWLKDDAVIPRLQNPTRLISSNGDRLYITSLTTYDSGIYSCQEYVEDIFYTRNIYRLIVIDENIQDENSPGKIPKITSNMDMSKKIQEGLSVYIDCGCSDCWPLYSYFWSTPLGNFSDQKDNPPKNFFINHKIERGNFHLSLEIRDIRKSDEGTYICKLENSLGSDSTEYSIDVDVFKAGPTKIVGFEGYMIAIECPYTYSDWNIDLNQVSFYNLTNRKQQFSTRKYIAFPLKKDHSKYYSCVQQSGIYGEVVHTLYDLEVISLDEPEVPYENMVLLESEYTTLDCGSSSGTNYTWLHNGKVVKNQSSSVDDLDKDKIVVPGNFGSNGLYKCIYIDHTGVNQTKEMLVVVEPKSAPVLLPILQQDRLMKGHIWTHNIHSEVTIQRDFLMCFDFITIECRCTSSCFPLLNYTWKLPETCSSDDVEEKLVLDEETDDEIIYSLTIPVSNQCNGIFVCELENSNGSSQHTFTITVENALESETDLNICCTSSKRKKGVSIYYYEMDNVCGGW